MIDLKLNNNCECVIDYEILQLFNRVYVKGGKPHFVGKIYKIMNIWEEVIKYGRIDLKDFEYVLNAFMEDSLEKVIYEEIKIHYTLINLQINYIKSKLAQAYLNNIIDKAKIELLDILKNYSKGGDKYEIQGEEIMLVKDKYGIISTKLSKTVNINGIDKILFLTKDRFLNDILVDDKGNVLFKGNNIDIVGDKFIKVDGKLYDIKGNLLLGGLLYVGHIVVGNNYYFVQINQDNKKYYVNEKGDIMLNGMIFEKVMGHYFYSGKDFFYGINDKNEFVIIESSGDIVFQDKDINIKLSTVCKLPLLQSIQKSNGECLFLLNHKILEFSIYLGDNGKVGFFYQQVNGLLTPYIVYESSRFNGNRVIDLDGNNIFQKYIDMNLKIDYFKVNSMIHLTDFGYIYDIIIGNNGEKFHIILDASGNRLFKVNGKIKDVIGICKTTDGKVYLNALLVQDKVLSSIESEKLIQLDGKISNKQDIQNLFNLEFVDIEIK